MMVVTKFDIGDTVKVGPHEGRVVRIVVGQAITYGVALWIDGQATDYAAYDWELTLVERMVQTEKEG